MDIFERYSCKEMEFFFFSSFLVQWFAICAGAKEIDRKVSQEVRNQGGRVFSALNPCLS